MLEGVCWIVDPIDGTHPYIHGLSRWGISIARMQQSMITDGGIFLPDIRTLLITDGERVLNVQFGPNREEWVIPDILTPLAPLTDSSRLGIVSLPQDITKYGNYLGRESVQTNGCCIYSVAQFLLGNYDGVILRVKLWDVAACLALVLRTSAALITHSDDPIDNRVSKQLYYLEPDHNKLWSMKTHIYLARTLTASKHIRTHTRLPH